MKSRRRRPARAASSRSSWRRPTGQGERSRRTGPAARAPVEPNAAARQKKARPVPAITAAVLQGTLAPTGPATAPRSGPSEWPALPKRSARRVPGRPAAAAARGRPGGRRRARKVRRARRRCATIRTERGCRRRRDRPWRSAPTRSTPARWRASEVVREIGIIEVATAASRPPAKPWMARPRMTTAMLGAIAQQMLPPTKSSSRARRPGAPAGRAGSPASASRRRWSQFQRPSRPRRRRRHRRSPTMEGRDVDVMNMKKACSTTPLVSTIERPALPPEKKCLIWGRGLAGAVLAAGSAWPRTVSTHFLRPLRTAARRHGGSSF